MHPVYTLRLQSEFRWATMSEEAEPLSDDAPGQGLYIFAYLFSMAALAVTMFLYT